MLAIMSAIYEMVQNVQSIQPFAVKNQVDRFFEKMDANRDGVVTREEFMSGCKNVRAKIILLHYEDNNGFDTRRTVFRKRIKGLKSYLLSHFTFISLD